VDTLVKMLTMVAQTVGPEAMQFGMKVEDVPEYIAEKMGVSQSLIRNSQERAQLQQAAAQAMKAQAMQDQQQQKG